MLLNKIPFPKSDSENFPFINYLFKINHKKFGSLPRKEVIFENFEKNLI